MKQFSQEAWVDLLERSIQNINTLAKLKGGEYAGDVDRLANFRRNAANLGLQMEQVWAVYAGKHWDAVIQYIKDLQTNTKRERMEPIEGRIDDLMVYLLLFKAMLQESHNEARPPTTTDGFSYGRLRCPHCNTYYRPGERHACAPR